MRTDELLDQCLAALTSGEELPVDLARYLIRHPEQRDEVEELLTIAQRASRLRGAELTPSTRRNMQVRLATRLGFDLDVLPNNGQYGNHQEEQFISQEQAPRKKPLLLLGRVSLAKMRYMPPSGTSDDFSEAKIRAVFGDLTSEDIRRYIGVRGEDYLYYRQRLPGWEPILSMIALMLRGLKRLEMLVIET